MHSITNSFRKHRDAEMIIQTLETESTDLKCSLTHGNTLTRLAYMEAESNFAAGFSLSTNVIICQQQLTRLPV